MRTLIESLVSAWQPQWCVVRPHSLREATGRETLDILASWIVYLDREVCRRTGDLPDGVRKLDGPSGHVIVLAPTPAELRLATIDKLRDCVALPDTWSRLR